MDDPTDDQISAASVVVAVKRPPAGLAARCARAGVPLVYDVVDAWPQPMGNNWDETGARRWLRQRIVEVSPQVVVAATTAMRDHLCEDLPSRIRVEMVAHHARPLLWPCPRREGPVRVGYEGAAHYLGHWWALLTKLCEQRGMEFVVNPASLNEVDIVVALRSGEWRGWPTDNWKSGVKLSNAQAAGLPAILLPECGYRDVASGAELWVETSADLARALDTLGDRDDRRARSDIMFGATLRLEDVEHTWRQLLATLS